MNTVLGPTRRLGNVSRRRSVTTKPRTESPRCSSLQSDGESGARNYGGLRETWRSNGAYISLSKLGSSEKRVNHALSEETVGLYGGIHITLIHTWLIFEESGLSSEETTMGEYLQPDISIFDVG